MAVFTGVGLWFVVDFGWPFDGDPLFLPERPSA